MSPSPEQFPRHSKSSRTFPPEQSSPESRPDQEADAVDAQPVDGVPEDQSPSLLRRPMRPVRPQPPATPVTPDKPATPEIATRENASIPAAEIVAPKKPLTAVESESEEAIAAIARHRPIPPPSEPKQFRAIGLLRGHYIPSSEKFTRGEMITHDGTAIEAVLLGRVMSLVRNHLDLEKDHLWVVYPRTREKDGEQLHVQVVGVWEPETLSKEDLEAEGQESAPAVASAEVEDDYFSIRGEVIYYAPDTENVVVKIQQVAKKDDDRPKAFKLHLKGTLAVMGKTPGYFWDFQVRRNQADLMITDSRCVGLLPPRKKSKDEMGRPPMRRFTPRSGDGGGRPPRPPQAGLPRREPIAKPIKRGEAASEG